MKIVQKIDTGGTNKTRTPMLKLRMNELFDPSDARHIAHWANVVVAPKSKSRASAKAARTERNMYRFDFTTVVTVSPLTRSLPL